MVLNWTQLTILLDFQDQGGQAWYDLYCRVNPENPNIVYVGTIDVWSTIQMEQILQILQMVMPAVVFTSINIFYSFTQQMKTL